MFHDFLAEQGDQIQARRSTGVSPPFRQGRVRAAARDAYEIAIGLERDPAVRRFLQRRQETVAA